MKTITILTNEMYELTFERILRDWLAFDSQRCSSLCLYTSSLCAILCSVCMRVCVYNADGLIEPNNNNIKHANAHVLR